MSSCEPINIPYPVSSHLTFRSVFLNLTDYQKHPGLSLTAQTPRILCWVRMSSSSDEGKESVLQEEPKWSWELENFEKLL